jgi:hypothetical protein
MAVQPRTNVPVWQRPQDQVKKLTHELHLLQSELFRELAEREQDSNHSNFSPSGAAGELRELKAAADEIRHVLWLYLEKPAETRPREQTGVGDPDNRRQLAQPGRLQMQGGESSATTMQPGSFFERLNLVIEGYMQNRGIRAGETRPKS